MRARRAQPGFVVSAEMVRASCLRGIARPRRRSSRASLVPIYFSPASPTAEPAGFSLTPKSCSTSLSWRRARSAAARRVLVSASVCTARSASAADLTVFGSTLPVPCPAPGMPAANRHSRRRAAGVGAGIRSRASATRMAAVKKSTRGDSDPMTRFSSGQVETASRPRAGLRKSEVRAAQM